MGDRACPACGSVSRRDIVFAQRFAHSDRAVLDGYDVVICAACGAAFADGIPAQETLDSYYTMRSKYAYGATDGRESVHDATRLAAGAEWLATRVDARELPVLDVGAASGRFLHELRARGFTNVRGLDPSPACASAARRLYDVRVDAGTLWDLGREGGRAGIVSLIGVLEHVRDVSRALVAVRNALAPTGMLYLEVPDAARFAAHANAPFQEFSAEHVNFFSEASLRTALRHAGFKIDAVEQVDRRTAARTLAPTLVVLARVTNGAAPLARDDVSRASLEQYVRHCAADEAAVVARIATIAADRDPVIVWGAGTWCRRLIQAGAFAELTVAALVDTDPALHGAMIGPYRVAAPTDVAHLASRVIVASRAFGDDVRASVAELMGESVQLLAI